MIDSQKVLFIVVGIANTAVDFTVLNIAGAIFGLPTLLANSFSVTVAMVFSFFANKLLVFSERPKSKNGFFRFIIITVISLYILQNFVIVVLTQWIEWPLDIAYQISQDLDLRVSREFVFTNGAKAVATVFSAVFNFIMYDRYVFNEKT